MEYIKGLQKTYLTYNGYECVYYRFDIYADTNYWDSNRVDSDRDLFISLSLSSTDFYSSDTLNIMSWYSTNSYNTSQLTSFINNSDNRYHLTSDVGNNFDVYTYNNFINVYEQSYLEDIGNTWNNSEYWNIILYYNSNDVYVDSAYINVCNKFDSPFYSSIINDGYRNGYNTGYTNGLNANQQTIYEDGYQNGYNTGYEDGYIEGGADSEEEWYYGGYRDGYEDGYIVGYDKGHLDGIDDAESGEYNLSSMVVKVADTPINIFKSIFDIEFMGINLVPVIFGITALGIAVWLVRRFMGGD